MKSVEEQIEYFVEACRRVGSSGLVRCSSGNMAQRLDGGRVLLTGTRTWLATLSVQQVSVCRLADGAVLNGVRPSVETAMHLGILRMREEVGTVLHFQSPCATTLACWREESVEFGVIPEVPCYIGPVGWVPYLTPGSPELAQAVVEVAGAHDMIVMRNHGLVTVGADADDAFQRASFFELACEVILRGGRGVVPISAQDARALRAAALNGRGGA